jgi:hypothetical protein
MKITEDDICIQFGAGDEAVPGWPNFGVPPRFRLQRLPFIGMFFNDTCVFDSDVFDGDTVKGLPRAPYTLKGLFASHVLGHFSYDGTLTALKNSHEMLKPAGCFRLIAPNLKFLWMNITQEQVAM